MKNYYRILGLEPLATAEEIKKSFRKMAFETHPDHHPNDPRAMEAFQAINEAHSILSDPESRMDYDRKFRKRFYRTERQNRQNKKSSSSVVQDVEAAKKFVYFESISRAWHETETIPLRQLAMAGFMAMIIFFVTKDWAIWAGWLPSELSITFVGYAPTALTATFATGVLGPISAAFFENNKKVKWLLVTMVAAVLLASGIGIIFSLFSSLFESIGSAENPRFYSNSLVAAIIVSSAIAAFLAAVHFAYKTGLSDGPA